MFTKLLDPKNDVAFLKNFGSEQHKTVLIHFINDILVLKSHQKIEQVECLKTVWNPDIALKKQSIVDALCKDAQGVQYNIESKRLKPEALNSVLSTMPPKPMANQPIAVIAIII